MNFQLLFKTVCNMCNAQRIVSSSLAMYCSVLLGTCSYMCTTFGLRKYSEASYQKTCFSRHCSPTLYWIYIFLRRRPKLKCCRLETQNVVRFRDLETWLACLVSVIYRVDDHLCVRISCEIVHDPLQLSTRIIAPDHGTPPETRVFLLCLPCASISLWVQGRLAPRRSNNFDFSIFRVISA